jgi:hypothetical protein
MAITDKILSRSLENGVMTIKWAKSGSFSYKKTPFGWRTIPDNKFVGMKTKDFLDDQYERIKK